MSDTKPAKQPESSSLLGYSLADLEALYAEMGQKPYRVKQTMEWIYKQRISDIEEMSNLPAEGFQALYAIAKGRAALPMGRQRDMEHPRPNAREKVQRHER